MCGRWLTTQQRDERRQDNGDRRRLARKHPNDLLRSLTRERDRHDVVSIDRALSFAIYFELSMGLAWGTWCACVYLVLQYSETFEANRWHENSRFWTPIIVHRHHAAYLLGRYCRIGMVEVNSYKGRDNSTIKLSYSTFIENFWRDASCCLPTSRWLHIFGSRVSHSHSARCHYSGKSAILINHLYCMYRSSVCYWKCDSNGSIWHPATH